MQSEFLETVTRWAAATVHPDSQTQVTDSDACLHMGCDDRTIENVFVALVEAMPQGRNKQLIYIFLLETHVSFACSHAVGLFSRFSRGAILDHAQNMLVSTADT